MKKINLFCFPYAGGNKYSYRNYQSCAPSMLNVIPVEYPGRGARISEDIISDMASLVDILLPDIIVQANSESYALYGHSMGALVAYLLARRLEDHQVNKPLHLIVSGAMGPASANRYNEQKHLLGKKEFIEEIRKLDGCPPEILESEDLLEYFEPIFRTDFQVTETFSYLDRPPLDIPITVITGSEEQISLSDIQLWQQESLYTVDFRQMKGGHFFINNHFDEIIQIICKKLLTPVKNNFYERKKDVFEAKRSI